MQSMTEGLCNIPMLYKHDNPSAFTSFRHLPLHKGGFRTFTPGPNPGFKRYHSAQNPSNLFYPNIKPHIDSPPNWEDPRNLSFSRLKT